MNFKGWLDYHKVSVIEASQLLGYSRQRLYQVINQENPAGAELIRAILKLTNDEVSVQSLLVSKKKKKKRKSR
jgi:hypothetical protein